MSILPFSATIPMVNMVLISCYVYSVKFEKIIEIVGSGIMTADLRYVGCAGTQESKVCRFS